MRKQPNPGANWEHGNVLEKKLEPSHQVDEYFADKSGFLDVNYTTFYESLEFYLTGRWGDIFPRNNSNQPCRTSIPGGWDLQSNGFLVCHVFQLENIMVD